MSLQPTITPLSLNSLTRDTWGNYDVAVMAQIADLANDPCYQQKFYRAPTSEQEVFGPDAYVPFGLHITPGSIIYGFYLPMIPDAGDLTASVPPAFTVQITDLSLGHQFWDAPIASLFISNYKPTYQSNGFSGAGSFPNLLAAPHPVVGSGQFLVEIQSTSASTQRLQLVFGVLEVCQGTI